MGDARRALARGSGRAPAGGDAWLGAAGNAGGRFVRATPPPVVASTALPERRGRRGEHRLERGHVCVEPIQRGIAHGDRAAAVDDAAM